MDILYASVLGAVKNDSKGLTAVIRSFGYVLKNQKAILKKRQANYYRIPSKFIVKTPYFLPMQKYKKFALRKLADINNLERSAS